MGPSTVESAAELAGVRSAWTSWTSLRRPARNAGEPTAGLTRRHLLMLRFAVLNGAIAAFMAVAASLGWFDRMMATDVFHIVKLIVLVFAIGLYQCGQRILQLTGELNAMADGAPPRGTRAGDYLAGLRSAGPESRALLASALKLKLGTRLGHIRFIASSLVMLGLVGTVIGFIVALTGVDEHAAGDASAAGPMVSALLLGMGMAMYKTLAGIVCNLWLMLNYRLLEHGTVHFYTSLVEAGERR